MLVKNDTVEQIENVAGNDRGHRHETPILRQAVNAEAFGHNGRKYPKEKAVSESGQAGDEAKEVWVDDAEGADLGDEKDGTGDDQAPDSARMEYFDQEIRSDAFLVSVS